MQLPVETLERVSFRSKRVADPGVNLEQLRRESETTRREWWEEVEANKREYNNLPYDRGKFLESNMALARLKLVASFLDNGETPPSHHGFREEELNLLRDFEQFIVYDRLSVEDIKDYIKSAKEDGKGIIKLARHAAENGYDQMYKIMEQRNIPSDLALAFQRIYQERIKKMEAAAAEIRLSEVYRGIEAVVEAKEAVAEKAVTAQEARILEHSYVGQVEARLRQPNRELDWKKIERFNSLENIFSELKAIKPISKEAVRDNLPNGLGVRTIIETGKLFFKKPSLILEVRVLSDYKNLHLRGFDTEISFGEMMVRVEQAIARAKEYPCVLGLVSTSGWEEEAVNYVKEGRALSPRLSLVLAELKDKKMHYNPGDTRLAQVLPYLEVG